MRRRAGDIARRQLNRQRSSSVRGMQLFREALGGFNLLRQAAQRKLMASKRLSVGEIWRDELKLIEGQWK